MENDGKCKNWKDLSEWAWGVIANAGANLGDWKSMSKEWQEIAPKWREEYHRLLKLDNDGTGKADGEEVRLTLDEIDRLIIAESSASDWKPLTDEVETILTARLASQLKDIQERLSVEKINSILQNELYYRGMNFSTSITKTIARAIHDKISEVGK